MARRDGPGQGGSRPALARKLVAFILALDRLAKGRVVAEISSASSRTHQRDGPFLDSTVDQKDALFDDLPEGFHDDVDSITLAVGGHHTCALEYRPGVDFGGPVRCWGRDDWGQSTPSDEIFVQVTAGDRHTCGIKIDQTVSCWGHMRFAPQGLFQQLSVGGHHTCGLRREGTAVCWGDDLDGSVSLVPKRTIYVQVVAGKDNSCGLRPNGQVDCWGGNKMGQSNPPRDVQFRQISASKSRHVCGLTLDRGIQCWGRGMRGETQFRAGPWHQVTCGKWTTCGIRAKDGGIECWGMNNVDKSDVSYEEVSSADYHTCAVSEYGEVECWGNAMRAEQVPDGFQAA
ncbi:unnamed protein product [Hapterophycus canaliculatus]